MFFIYIILQIFPNIIKYILIFKSYFFYIAYFIN